MNSRKLWFAAFAASFSVVLASAATLPTATEIFNQMGFGINIGNTMEVPGVLIFQIARLWCLSVDGW